MTNPTEKHQPALSAPLCALALLAAAACAQAASFDCSKTSGPFEQLVCSDPGLSAADEQLAAVYRASLEAFSGTAREQIVQSQRAWLGWWPHYCSGSPTSVALGSQQLACARDAYASRLRDLNVPSVLGGTAVYYHSQYSALPGRHPAPDGRPIRATHEARVPQLQGQSEDDASTRRLAAINAWLAAGLADWEKVSQDPGRDTGLQVSLVDLTPELLGAVDSSFEYPHGAAHPVSAQTARYFLVGEQRPMTAADFLADDIAVLEMGDFAFDSLQKKFGADILHFFVRDRAELHQLVKDVGRWRLDGDGLTLAFNVYEVASRADGPQAVTIPWARLNGHLTEFARRQVAAIQRRPPGQPRP